MPWQSEDVFWNFELAVDSMATGTADIRQRLLFAAEKCFARAIESSELPEEVRSDFEALQSLLTRQKPLANEGTIRASIDAMSDAEVKRAAERLVEIRGLLLFHRDDAIRKGEVASE